jgi:26S proteasome regulatory subunit N1
MIHLWDVDSGLSQIDKYLHSTDNHVVAGALLGVGIVNCGIKNDCDPVLSLSLSLLNLCFFLPLTLFLRA